MALRQLQQIVKRGAGSSNHSSDFRREQKGTGKPEQNAAIHHTGEHQKESYERNQMEKRLQESGCRIYKECGEKYAEREEGRGLHLQNQQVESEQGEHHQMG